MGGILVLNMNISESEKRVYINVSGYINKRDANNFLNNYKQTMKNKKASLYKLIVSPDFFECEDEEDIKRKTTAMYQYYSPENEKEYGVVGIKISLHSTGFRYTYNKLVRDKIPENIDSEPGRKSKYRILDDKEYLTELNKKVIEEANEFIEENSIEELGDLMEVINAIMKLKGYKMEEVYKIMKVKEEKKGAFYNKIYLEYVDEEKRNLDEEKELNKEFRK